MKKILLILVCLWAMTGVKAQIARWLISPSYESIQLADGIDAIITDSAGIRVVWTMNGKRLITSNNEIYPFKEGLALSVKRGSSTISSIYKQNGDSIRIEGCNVTHQYPYYSNGKLLVQQGTFYRFIDSNGNILDGKYTSAFPYFNGYAVCDTYLNMEKMKNIRHMLIGK